MSSSSIDKYIIHLISKQNQIDQIRYQYFLVYKIVLKLINIMIN